MRKIYKFLALVSLVLSGCQQEIDVHSEPDSKYLVIKASVAETKTDITKGSTLWEEGDQITVMYDGASYLYTAQESGLSTTFTSTAGIVEYDSSKSCVAYFPATTDGVIEVKDEATLTFKSETQETSANAPLVGTPSAKNLQNGTLDMNFENVFSTLELIVDAGNISSPAKTLLIEPADASDFTGYLACKGTVNAENREVTTSSESNKITLTFPSNTLLTSGLNVKIPIGRFATSSGLKLTLTTTSGATYLKTIFKSGIESYSKSSTGVYSAIHFGKPLFAFANPGGISDATDLMEFAAAVNSGGDVSKWMNDEGKVVLLDDIDMKDVESWTPIGSAVFNNKNTSLELTSGTCFTGYFDGNNHTIKNLKMLCANSTKGAAWGFFGALGKGAVVENLIFDSGCSLGISCTQPTDCGVVAGIVWDARVINVTNNAKITITADAASTAKSTVGVVGGALAQTDSVVLKKIVNNAEIVAASANNTTNGATAVHVGGILGFGAATSGTSNLVAVLNCVNNGNITSATARTSGIVAACNNGTHIRDCVNYGNQLNTFATANGARLGNITCIMGTACEMYNTKNYGDLISTTSGAVGGVICLVNSDDNILEGVETYGRVISDKENNKYKGTFFGSCNKAAEFKNCIAGSVVGKYNNGVYQMENITAENYFDYIGQVGTNAKNVTKENIKYGTANN